MVNQEINQAYRSLLAMCWPTFERCSGFNTHKLETQLYSLRVKRHLADMLVVEIRQNDALLCANTLPSPQYLPLPFLSLSVLNTSTCTLSFFAHAHTKHTCISRSLMCQRLLVMRFLQDGKLQGHWLTTHFKHCSPPFSFLSCGTQRIKRGQEEHLKKKKKSIVSHTDTHTPEIMWKIN